MITKKAAITASILTLLGTGAAAVPVFAATNQSSSAQTAVQQKHEHKGPGLLGEISSVLGIDKKTLVQDLKAGQSLADIAQSKGISQQTLVSDLQSKLKTRLDQAVSNGKLTADKESQILSKSQSRIEKLITQKGLFQKQGHQGQGPQYLNEVSSIVGIDTQTLVKDLKAGQSLADIAQSKGISEQTLVSDLVSNLKAKLDKQVAAGKLTADKESQMLAKAQQRIGKFVTRHSTGNKTQAPSQSN